MTLPVVHVHALNGVLATQQDDHEEWLLVAQDCDLAWNAIVGSDSLIELRPVFHDSPPEDWGIRAARLKVDSSGAYIRSEAPAVRVTPAVLLEAEHVTCPHPRAPARS